MDALVVDHPGAKRSAPPHCDEIRREAVDRLRRSGDLALSDVSCDARDDVIYLRGRLPSYSLKQSAQAVATEVEGVRRVVNRIEVIAPARLAPIGCDRVATHCDGLK